jgi:DNA polymerase bacteriophage-type
MRTLSIDIETYSEISIGDCGSFRYIDDDSFEILLFGYAFGENTPTVIDLTKGEAIPDDVVEALYSPDCIKTG